MRPRSLARVGSRERAGRCSPQSKGLGLHLALTPGAEPLDRRSKGEGGLENPSVAALKLSMAYPGAPRLGRERRYSPQSKGLGLPLAVTPVAETLDRRSKGEGGLENPPSVEALKFRTPDLSRKIMDTGE